MKTFGKRFLSLISIIVLLATLVPTTALVINASEQWIISEAEHHSRRISEKGLSANVVIVDNNEAKHESNLNPSFSGGNAVELSGNSSGIAIPMAIGEGNVEFDVYIGYDYGNLQTQKKDGLYKNGLWVSVFVPLNSNSELSDWADVGWQTDSIERATTSTFDNSLFKFVVYQHLDKVPSGGEKSVTVPTNVGSGNYYVSVATDSETLEYGGNDAVGYFDYIKYDMNMAKGNWEYIVSGEIPSGGKWTDVNVDVDLTNYVTAKLVVDANLDGYTWLNAFVNDIALFPEGDMGPKEVSLDEYCGQKFTLYLGANGTRNYRVLGIKKLTNDGLQYMNDAMATSFIGFIYNKKANEVTDEMKSKNDIYNYLTGRLVKGTDEYIYAQAAFLLTQDAFVNKQIQKANAISTISSENLINALQEKMGDNSDASGAAINEALKKVKKRVVRILYYVCGFNNDKALSEYEKIPNVKKKVEDFIFAVKSTINGSFLITSRNTSKAYDYYATYVMQREHNYSDLFMGVYNIGNIHEMDGINIFLDVLGFGNSWTNEDVQRVLRTFGDFTYYSMLEMQNYNKNESSTESTPKKETVDFIYNNYSLFMNDKLNNPAFSTNSGEVTYSSEDNSIATIDEEGNITAISEGQVEIKAKSENGTIGSCNITVLPFYASKSDSTYIIEKYIGKIKEVIIPSYINGNKVSNIEEDIFTNCNEVTIKCEPDSVAEKYSIDNNIDYILIYDNLEYKCLDEGIKIITCNSSNAFVRIPSFINNDTVKYVGVDAFKNCESITNLTIPDSITNIENYAFSGCTAISDVYYTGTKAQWNQIIIDEGNEYLINANIHCVPEENLTFTGASLTLYDNIAVNYKADASLFEESGYENPYVKFTLNDKEIIVDEYTEVNGKYVFDFTDIAPNQMKDTIYATLYATYDGVVYQSETKEYSVSTYCYNMLGKYSSDDYAEFRTLLVDLLNYGAASQIYTDHNTDDLVNADLTEEQAAWGTSETPELETVMDKAYETISNPTVTWKGAGLNLEDSVTMRFKIATESIEDLKVKVTNDAGEEWIIYSDTFEATTGGYYVFFDGLNAGQMSEAVYVTVYEGNTKVSDTIRYSIESYAYTKQNSGDEKLDNLLIAMMKYGNAANSYIN